MPAQAIVAGHVRPRQVATQAEILTSIRESRASRRGGRPRAEGRSGPDRRVTGGAGRLGNHAKTAATAGQDHKTDLRADRYRARSWLSTVTDLPRVSRCGRVSVIEGGEVLLKATATAEGTRAGFGGLSTCGSVWACPVCSAKIAARRTQEIESLLAWNAARGGSVALATFTMRHHTGHRLRDLRKALSVAWRHITSSRAWKETRKREGCDGYVRAIECTYGENGWHLHIHVLLIFDGPITQEFAAEWSDELYELWAAGLDKCGMQASREHGVDVRVGSGALDGLGKYLSKLTFETAGGRFKKGRKGGRTPFELLDDAINTGLAEDFDAWFEWERGSKGMRQLTWSRGLKAMVGVDESSDEEIAEEEDGGQTVARITPAGWRVLYWKAAELLSIVEQGGPQVACAWMDRRGITFEVSKAME